MLRFFSKLVLICNGCFALSVLFRYAGKAREAESLAPLPLYLQWVLILGMAALLLNLFFILTCAGYFAFRKPTGIARWLILLNAAFLVFQLLYYNLLT